MGLQPPFGARSQEKDGVATIALSGELDMATAPILSDSLAPFEGNGVSTIVLDLHDLTFIDSTGLHAFLEARNRATSNGQRLLVRGASPTAQRHVEIVGLQFLWTIRSTTWSYSYKSSGSFMPGHRARPRVQPIGRVHPVPPG
jgi:anti-sigma B factor antagonist